MALLTLTLLGVMDYRGMLRRPVGLLPTPLQRASSTPLGQPGPQFAAGASSATVTVVSAMDPSSVAAGIRGGISSDAVGVVAPSGHAPYDFSEQQLGEVEHASWNGQQLARVRANGVSSPGRGAFAERQRGLAMARMQITHFKCLSCAASIRNGEDKCGACGYERPAASALVSSVREQERGAL